MSKFWQQDNAVVAAIDVTAAGATGTATSDTIDMSRFGRVAIIVYTGTQTTTGAATLTIQSGTATGTVTTSVTSYAIAANSDNVQRVYEIHDTALSGRYMNFTLAQTTATGYIGAVAIADQAHHKPATDDDVASVTVVAPLT